MGHLVRVGGVAGQALPADFVHSPDAPIHIEEESAVEPDYSSLTKDQLYALAQERDIPGRSDMTRDELIDVLGG